MKFEWDEQKNQANIKKHGMDFADAHKVFEYPMLVNLDDRQDYGEDRSERPPAMSESDMNKPTKTNLERLDAMTDDMIDTSDIPPLTDRFFTTAKWRMPKPTVKVTVEVEPEVVEWFRAQGDNYERYLAAALRIYAQAHRAPEMAKAG